jgi:DNA repair protein RadD
MFNIRNIISRADEHTIQIILGKQLLKLIQLLDPKYVKTSQLKNLIFEIHDERIFLDDRNYRSILINLLKIGEAKLLAETFGFLNSVENNEYEFLKKKKFVNRSEDQIIFYNFFNVSIPSYSMIETSILESKSFINGNYQLFPHQRNAIRALNEKLNTYPYRVLLHMPTGSGKTRTSMNVLCEYLRNQESAVIIWLASTEELCSQAHSEFNRAWASLGNRQVEIAKLWGNNNILDVLELKEGLIVAGFQKLTNFLNTTEGLKLLSKIARNISFIVVDEAHQSIADRYQSVIEIIFNSSSGTKLLGLSATPGRTWNNIEEDQKLADFFNRQKVTLKIQDYDNPVDYLVENDYIAKVNYRNLKYYNDDTISDQINKDRFSNRNDFSKELLSLLGQDTNRNIRIIQEIINLSSRHKRIIVFTPSVESSEIISSILKIKGYNINSITSKTDLEKRRSIINDFKFADDKLKIICNYGVLTTGFDSPNTSAALIARPTLSLVLYSQMVGRAIRGLKAGGNAEAEIVTVIDTELPGFKSVADSFYNWEDVWND